MSVARHAVVMPNLPSRLNASGRSFWQRADLKWHGYEPRPEVARLEQFLALVEEDEYACFFG